MNWVALFITRCINNIINWLLFFHLVYDERFHILLRENCSYSELFWSVFSRIRTAYGEILCGKIRTRLTPNTETFYAEFSFQYLPKCPKRPNFKYIFSFIFLLKTFFRPEQLHPEVHY